MTILTANIAYGFPGMDSMLTSVKHQLHIHGWGVLAYEFAPPLRGKFSTVSKTKRSAYVRKNNRLDPILDVVSQSGPDVLVLNETIYEIYREELEAALRRMGFQSVAWGLSTHYPGTTISTVVATKQAGAPIVCVMPQRPSIGGGAGMAGLRLLDAPISVFGVHLTYRSPALFKQQLNYIARTAAKEKSCGNEVVLAGDWNESEETITAFSEFKELDLRPAALFEIPTCPTFLPQFLRKPLDHVFVPSYWKGNTSKAVAFGSDHLALVVNVEPKMRRRYSTGVGR
jgi:endonuclease/exonuclease/phosphatase family metal-dependent hydrolase